MIDKSKLANAAMSDEELDNVAGGRAGEMADDSRFLNSLNGSCDRYGTAKMWGSAEKRAEVTKAWETVGITAKLNCSLLGNSNKYFLNGKQITQEEARQHAMEVTGHHMTESDWKW